MGRLAMRQRGAANVLLRRAQLVLMLSVLLPSLLLTPVGIVLLAAGRGSVAVVTGVLVLSFCTTAVTGFFLGWVLMHRGASMAQLQNEFLAVVSHELRTPLTSINLFIETLREDRVRDAEERRKLLDLLYQEMTRLDGLVGRLIELSRLESARQPFVREPVAIDGVVADAVATLHTASLGASVDLRVEVEPGLQVVGDRAALARAVANLLVNAWKYTPDRGHIDLRARSRARKVEIVVADDGPGVAVGEERRIFEKFERGRAARIGEAAGSGLGLAIVRAIVDAHRGTIDLSPEQAGGACFRILLPRHG
jgi:two-component system phosphate regulon sensor histidine kinase PhoR